jgi:hypothetical protein
MRGLLPAAKASFCCAAADAQVEVVVVRIGVRRLMKNPGGSNHRSRRALVPCGVSQETRLELVGAEEPLHAGSVVQDQGAHEMPVPRLVEAQDAVGQHREAETIELQPAVAMRSQAPGISREEQEVGVAPGTVRAMPRMCASVRIRQIADAKWVAAWKSVSYFTGGPLDSPDQRCSPVSGPLSGTHPPIAFSTICEPDRVMEVSVIHGANRDRLPRRQGLGHTRTDRDDSDCREKPNHSERMIAQGSA